MNKKKLLLVLLALAIVTSLSAGTLAIYTKTVTTVDNEVQAKKFVFTANAAKTYATDFELAPKDSWSYTFDVNNYDSASTAEVPLDYTIAIDAEAATATLTGLQTKLEKLVGENWVELSDVTTGKINVKDDGIAATGSSDTLGATDASAKSTCKYKVTLTWADDGDHNKEHTSEGTSPVNKGLKVTVTASQNTVGSNVIAASGASGTGDDQE